jgi:hypothetical protein
MIYPLSGNYMPELPAAFQVLINAVTGKVRTGSNMSG